jgi:hypothetical protein
MVATDEAEQVEDMFTANCERRIAQKVIEILKSHPGSDIFELSDYMSPYKTTSAKMSEQNGLSHILDGLRVLGFITCTRDQFWLSYQRKQVLCLTRKISVKPKSQARYVVFECDSCGAAVGNRSSQRSAVCTSCNHKNMINYCKVVCRTNSLVLLQNAIQKSIISRLANKRKILYTRV